MSPIMHGMSPIMHESNTKLTKVFLQPSFLVVNKIIFTFLSCLNKFINDLNYKCRSQWLRGLSRGSMAALLLGLRVRIPQGNVSVLLVSVMCYQVEVSATGRSLGQRSPTACGVVCLNECDRRTSQSHEKNKYVIDIITGKQISS
jgi:hypothetical protein